LAFWLEWWARSLPARARGRGHGFPRHSAGRSSQPVQQSAIVTPPAHRAAVALGSSLDSAQGTRAGHIQAGFDGLARLPGSRLVARSAIIQTAPVGPPGTLAPRAQSDYLNAAAVIETPLSPRVLLEAMLEIERARGRDRAAEGRWGPRTLDLDLLLYDALVVDEPGLTIPHPRLTERAFVLVPLAQVAGDWVVPGPGGGGLSVGEWRARLPADSLEGIRDAKVPGNRP
jgi:2-amino-4-hydroxy-6-hydroxymethyldihydropteridine diphosphokinase